MILTEQIDGRTSAQIADQVQTGLVRYVPGWPKQPPGGASRALVEIFAFYAGIVIDRLNKAPDKHFKVFLDLLGASLIPPQPARVPLTFSLTGPLEAVVPALTQVAAQPAKGETEPVVFETEREFVVTPAILDSIMVADPVHDKYADYSLLSKFNPLADTSDSQGARIFQGNQPVSHAFYISGGDLFSHPELVVLQADFTLHQDVKSSPRTLKCEICTPKDPTPLTPAKDTTAGLTTSGSLVFEKVPAIPGSLVDGRKGQWLRCELVDPIVPSMPLPWIKQIVLRGEVNRQRLKLDLANANALPLDLTKDFFPFGERPKFGDIFYISNDEAFSSPGAKVTIHFTLSNQVSANLSPLPPVRADGVKLLWEFWNGSAWVELGTAESASAVKNQATGFSDTTQAFTVSGDVTFVVPPEIRPCAVRTKEMHAWIRVRLIFGNYGLEAHLEKNIPVPANFSPPAIHSVEINYVLTHEGPPVEVVTCNNRRYATADLAAGFAPFVALQEPIACLYLGFYYDPSYPTYPSTRSMSMYFMVDRPFIPKEGYRDDGAASLVWEFWDPSQHAWSKRNVIDETDGLRRSGIVRVLAPANFSDSQEFGCTRSWLRIHRSDVKNAYEPVLLRIFLNTTMAAHTLTTQEEILGASNGTPSQEFKASRSPVLAGPQLEVLEPVPLAAGALPPPDEAPVANPVTRREEVWMPWEEVNNFYGSRRHDRHYLLDHLTGIVTFGDGLKGSIPPISAKIRLAQYQTGGGVTGNKPVNSISQLKTTVPYIEKVTNLAPAAGGADTEEIADLLERAPTGTRHRGRAVTVEDYEDLARLASAAVAKVLCVPLYDLEEDPEAKFRRPGVVSLILVANFSGPDSPLSGETMNRVRRFLDDYRPPDIKLVITRPHYLSAQAEVEVTLTSFDLASQVELSLSRDLKDFLHPVTGGPGGKGWDFGQLPAKAELYRWIEAVPGVSHVRRVNLIHDSAEAQKYRHFLISPEDPRVTLTLPD